MKDGRSEYLDWILIRVLHVLLLLFFKLTSGHANFRMLSPSVCRLTLPLALCRGGASPFPPCTSSKTGNKSAASPERCSKSPGSSFLMALPEKGHSPDIFSSFSLVQNIFPPLWPPATAAALYLISEADCPGRAVATCGRNSIICCAHPGAALSLTADEDSNDQHQRRGAHTIFIAKLHTTITN